MKSAQILYVFFRQRQHKNKLHTNTFYLWSVLSANSLGDTGRWQGELRDRFKNLDMPRHCVAKQTTACCMRCIPQSHENSWQNCQKDCTSCLFFFLFSDISFEFVFMIAACTITSYFDYNDRFTGDVLKTVFFEFFFTCSYALLFE